MTDVFSGELVKAAHNADHESRIDVLETLDARIDALEAAWVDFPTMTITASTTAPTLGSSTKTAKYKQQGKVVEFTGRVQITTGGAWNAGSGTYYMLLPFEAATPIDQHTGSVFVNDSGAALRMGVCQLQDSTHLLCYYISAAASITAIGSAGPGSAWATSDHFEWSITYESV